MRILRSPGPSFVLVVAATLLLAANPHGARADVPDISQSYYVPEAGSVASPFVGTSATRFFTVCPNNDGLALLQHARIKIVLNDANGNPVPGISAADICILFNGGTPAQGYFGIGADSIVANSIWNASAGCPDLTCVPADAPTDENGTTYITFAGSTPGSPGVATRDPSRKWGHYDSRLPVYVMGMPIQGRLTTASLNGSYVLRIRNFDIVDGVSAKADRGSLVNHLDLNTAANFTSNYCGLAYWLDFNGSGNVNALDLNLLLAHLDHGCNTPASP